MLFGQKTINVKDPEIEFSFMKPNGWKTGDDGYNYLVFPPDKFDEAGISITYYENADSADIDGIFDNAVKYFYPNNEENFLITGKGEEVIGLAKAKWIQYQSTSKGNKYKNILYMFNDNGQTFKILGTAREKNFDNFKNDFIKIIRSVKSTKL